jgi:hypothetical protein
MVQPQEALAAEAGVFAKGATAGLGACGRLIETRIEKSYER